MIQQPGHPTGQNDRTNQPNGSTEQSQCHAPLQNQLKHICLARAERHADADLRNPLRHCVAQHARDAQRRQNESSSGKRSEQGCVELLRVSRFLQNTLHRLDIRDGQRPIKAMHFAVDCRSFQRRIKSGANHYLYGAPLVRDGVRQRVIRNLFVRGVRFGFRSLIQGALLHVAYNSYNCHPGILGIVFAPFDALADRIFSRPKTAGQRFVHQCHRRRSLYIAPVKDTAPLQRNPHGGKEIAQRPDMRHSARNVQRGRVLPIN